MKYSKARDRPSLKGVATMKTNNKKTARATSISGLSPK